jgi:hypothetical protein
MTEVQEQVRRAAAHYAAARRLQDGIRTIDPSARGGLEKAMRRHVQHVAVLAEDLCTAPLVTARARA